MKRLICAAPVLVLTLLLLTAFCPVAVASGDSTPDGSWSWQLAGSGSSLAAVACSDASHAWAVGRGGTILATSDGGATWVSQDAGTSDDLVGVSFPDATHGWAVGPYYFILVTSDGGLSWSKQDPTSALPNGHIVTGVKFVDALHGWIVGCVGHISGEDEGFIIATSDGGAHWSSQLSRAPGALRAVDFADVNHGIAVGHGIIYRTTDGGVHWLPTSAPASDWRLYSGVSYPDASHAWATTEQHIIASRDGGESWKVQHGTYTAVTQSVSFADSLHGCTLGLCTKDGGATWHKYNADVAPWTPLSAVVLADASHGWAVGGNKFSSDDPYQLILATATGGFGTAPTTRLASPLWQNGGATHIATWKLVATPDPSVGSVLRTEYQFDSLDVHGEWSVGTKPTLPAPSDHSGDGWRRLYFRSVGGNGAIEAYNWATTGIGIDTRRPTTAAPSRASVVRNKTAILKYRLADIAPNGGTAKVTIKIRNRAGKVVKTLPLGIKSVNASFSAKYRCTLAKGTYRFYVYAVDTAGNTQSKVGSNRLTVK